MTKTVQLEPVDLLETHSPKVGMVSIPGGTFRMGSNSHYVEEAPEHRVRVDKFWMDRYPVTNALFRKFVQETGYVTFAEIPPNPEDYPAHCRKCFIPAPWFSSSRLARWKTNGVLGGISFSARTGGIRWALKVRFRAWIIIR